MNKHQGYIVERVISNQKQEVFCNCDLDVCGLPACAKQPFTLKTIKVMDIKPVDSCSYPSQMYCRNTEIVQLHLNCWVIDACGCIHMGYARITVETRSADCAGSVRRGADVTIKRACYCGSSTFSFSAVITLHTLVSKCEYLCPSKCENNCPVRPLYPPARHDPCKCSRPSSLIDMSACGKPRA